jgi:hypothetical protein
VAERDVARRAVVLAQRASDLVLAHRPRRTDAHDDDAADVRRREQACARHAFGARGAHDRARANDVAQLDARLERERAPGSACRIPGCTNVVDASASGRSRPSKMWPSRPGPSGIASGAPCLRSTCRA